MAKIYFEILNENICSAANQPAPSYRAVPEWWKKMPKYNLKLSNNNAPEGLIYKDYGTARSCPALNDAFNFGYTLFNPIDIFIDATQEEKLSWYIPDINLSASGKDENSYVGFHPYEQLIGYQNDPIFHKHIMKINTFFGIKTDAGYSCWITHPVGRNDLPFQILDAIIDTDKYVSRSPYSFFIKRNFKGVIKAGTPLIQVIPFKRENFSSHIIKRDDENISRTTTAIKMTFTNAYKKLFWTRKKFT